MAAAAAGKKGSTSLSLLGIVWPPRPGQKQLGLANGTQNKEKHG